LGGSSEPGASAGAPATTFPSMGSIWNESLEGVGHKVQEGEGDWTEPPLTIGVGPSTDLDTGDQGIYIYYYKGFQ